MRCLVIRGEGEVLRFPVPRGEVRLGSDPSNDFVVPIDGVSRFHARLVPDSIAPRLFDLDSKNGLLIKGRRFREIALLPGVVVQVGAARITVEDGATSDFDLALEFPRPAVAPRRGSRSEAADTDTVSVGPGREGCAQPAARSREVRRAGTASTGCARPRGTAPECPRSDVGGAPARVAERARGGRRAGDEIPLEVHPAGTATGNEQGISIREVDGHAVAWRPSASAGGLAALVVLPLLGMYARKRYCHGDHL